MSRERNSKGQFVNGHSKTGGFIKGSKHSDKSKSLISKSLCGKFGDKARRWRGEKAGYAAKHIWIVKHYGKADRCEQKGCSYPKVVDAGRRIIEKPSRYEWANISGEYKRDRSDWVMLCPSCHRKIDMGKEKLCVV